MCLAVPMKLVEIGDDTGIAELGGVKREVNLGLLEGIDIGDYIIVHAGFAIQKLDKKEAEKTLGLLRELSNVSIQSTTSLRTFRQRDSSLRSE